VTALDVFVRAVQVTIWAIIALFMFSLVFVF
jgi:hypothetical protein